MTRLIIAVLTALVLTGCAPISFLTEVEHVSHPGAGWPVGPCNEEDSLTQASVLGHWRRGDLYLDAGIGAKLDRSSGFYGPTITGTVRVGREWRIAR